MRDKDKVLTLYMDLSGETRKIQAIVRGKPYVQLTARMEIEGIPDARHISRQNLLPELLKLQAEFPEKPPVSDP